MKTQLTAQDVKAIGFFLSSYEEDLRYAAAFRKFINSKQTPKYYLDNGAHSFTEFISAFRVARQLPIKNRKQYLISIKRYINSGRQMDVDEFVHRVRGLTTKNSLAVSLASKIFMLWNPTEIPPYDKQVKEKLSYKGNRYSEYRSKVRIHEKAIARKSKEQLHFLRPFIKVLERSNTGLCNISEFRYARFIDKMMWVKEKNQYE